jgi:hypothetical protein
MLPLEQSSARDREGPLPGNVEPFRIAQEAAQGLLLACYDPAPMALEVLQRPHWHGTPIELGDLFRLHKDRGEARAALFTHQLGWEVRLLVGSQFGSRADAGVPRSGGGAGDWGAVEGRSHGEGVAVM